MTDQVRTAEIHTDDTHIYAQWSGSGPPLLLLHGFPQTNLAWRDVAAELSRDFTVVCPDLRGYGRSGCPASAADHRPYAKRALARDMVLVMEQLGFHSFAVAGHDRGGRVAYRMALDHAEKVSHLAVLDVIPIAEAWHRADARFALSYWPWSLLAQPEPLPERIIAAAADAIVDHAMTHWGTPAATFPQPVRDAYVAALRDPAHAHAVCEEYRAAATVDRADDLADRRIGRRIACPVLVLWSARGGLDEWYAEAGGPVALWQNWADDVDGWAIDAGHFFPEEAPEVTANALRDFLLK